MQNSRQTTQSVQTTQPQSIQAQMIDRNTNKTQKKSNIYRDLTCCQFFSNSENIAECCYDIFCFFKSERNICINNCCCNFQTEDDCDGCCCKCICEGNDCEIACCCDCFGDDNCCDCDD